MTSYSFNTFLQNVISRLFVTISNQSSKNFEYTRFQNPDFAGFSSLKEANTLISLNLIF